MEEKGFLSHCLDRRHPDPENRIKKCQYHLPSLLHANKYNTCSSRCLDTSKNLRGHGEFDRRKEQDECVGSAGWGGSSKKCGFDGTQSNREMPLAATGKYSRWQTHTPGGKGCALIQTWTLDMHRSTNSCKNRFG